MLLLQHMDTRILEEIGFTKREIKVYLALIELGESTIGPISKKAKVTPAKVYPILEKLKQKGLITYVIKSGVKYFQMFNPKRIIDFLEDRQNKISDQKEEIKKLIPMIMSRQKIEAKQYATVYETFNGIKTLYDEILKHNMETKEDFTAFTLGEEYRSKEANIFFKNYDAKRKELGIKIKLLGLEHQREFYIKEFGGDPNIELRFLEHSLPTGVIVYGDNVVNLLWNDTPTAFVVHSKQNADAYRKFFYDMWKIAKKVPTKH